MSPGSGSGSTASTRALKTRIGGGAREEDFGGYMNNLGLPHPKQIAVAVPANLRAGEPEPLDARYLDDLKSLVDRVQPMWVSDHLCFTGVRGQNMHDLLPLPYTEEALNHVAERVVQKAPCPVLAVKKHE